MTEFLIRRLSALSRVGMLALASGLIGLAGAVDFLTGTDASTSVFYLVPIVLASWFLGRGEGLVMAALSGVAVTAADVLGRATRLAPWIHFWNAAGLFITFLVVAHLTARLRHYTRAQKDLARTDDLTGLANRRAFAEAALVEIARARRERKPLSVAFVDIDHFKALNDRFGHARGDEVLRRTAEVLRHALRETDVAARLGGDEFAFLLPQADSAMADAAAEKAHRALTAAVRAADCPVSFSIGMVTFPTPPATVDELLAAPDALMYAVKKSGKSAYRHSLWTVVPRSGDAVPRAAGAEKKEHA